MVGFHSCLLALGKLDRCLRKLRLERHPLCLQLLEICLLCHLQVREVLQTVDVEGLVSLNQG